MLTVYSIKNKPYLSCINLLLLYLQIQVWKSQCEILLILAWQFFQFLISGFGKFANQRRNLVHWQQIKLPLLESSYVKERGGIKKNKKKYKKSK